MNTSEPDAQDQFELTLRGLLVEQADVRTPERLTVAAATVLREATPDRGWLPPFTGRLQSMFSATKYVVAGAIVALFGGFLLAGVLTQPPSDESVPAFGASASASPQATDDLLARLETKEVAPGVLKVIGHEGVQAIDVGDDGSVRIAERGGIFELDHQGERLGDPLIDLFLMTATDGTLWAAVREPPSLRSFDGETWTRYDSGPSDYISDFAVHPDGTVWQVGEIEMYGQEADDSLEQLGPDGWTIHDISDELQRLGCDDRCGRWTIEITPDGAVWLGVAEGGLLRFDGTEWGVVRPLGGDEDHSILSLAANRDGILWAEIDTASDAQWDPSRLGEGRALARFDGQDWEVFHSAPPTDTWYAPDSEHNGPGRIQAVGPDGTVWLLDVYPDTDWGARLKDLRSQGTDAGVFPVSFDGERWTGHVEVQADWIDDPLNDNGWHLEGFGGWRITPGPDGTVWANVAGGGAAPGSLIYVITPEAVAATE